MTVTGLRAGRRGFHLPILALFSAGLIIVALVLFVMNLSRFAQGMDVLRTDITVGGVPVTGLKISEAASRWEQVYNQPIELDFQGNPILLKPGDIGFRPKSDLMEQDMRSKVGGTDSYWSDFWNYLWQRPTSPVDVELRADYQEAKLRDFLEDIAKRYELRASSASFDTTAMTFGAGTAGQRLDIDASMDAIDKALRRPTNRKVTLLMQGEGARTADMKTLKAAIQQYFVSRGFLPDGQTTIASVVVIDLQTGEEMSINPDVAYSSMSTIKIPILLNIFRKLTFAPDNDTKWLMGASILCSNNSASNYLMQLSGAGNNPGDQLADGLAKVTETVQQLGAKNTYISAPLYVADKAYQFQIPAPKTKPDPHFNASPDTYSQTTANDMASLLHETYDCSEYGSGLIAAFPDSYTQGECKQMIELLSGNIIGRMIELGVPPGTRVAHKNGWGKVGTGYNSSDAGIVYTPGGNYILAMYMWEKTDKEVGSILPWEVMEGISRIVYNYFNPDQPMIVARVPENQFTANDCIMPNPQHAERIDLNNINNGRFDANGNILPDACYNYPQCDPIPTDKLNGDQNGQATPVPPTTQNTQPTAPPVQQEPIPKSTLPPPPPK
jgi:beta-lactamase class A